MALFVNTSDTIGQGIIGLNSITGSTFMSILLIFILILALGLFFRIPIDFLALLLNPFLIVVMAFNSQWVAVGGVFLISLAILLGRNFFFNK
jgi:hypothetical protein